MKLLDRLERRFRRFAIPNLTLVLIIAQVAAFVLAQAPNAMQPGGFLDRLYLVPANVMAGEVWRLFTFLVVPPTDNILFAFFFWYMFYLMGHALEQQWGDFRYNVYLLIGYVLTVAASFLVPNQPSSNGYLEASVFLAFAFLFPNFELYIFFVLPVKIKWLAWLTWAGYVFTIAFGPWISKVLVLASIGNFFLFFGSEVLYRMRMGRRRMAYQAAKLTTKQRDYIHKCTVCGITDRTNPEMDFRYCSRCIGTHAYCSEHLKNHEHITTAETKTGS